MSKYSERNKHEAFVPTTREHETNIDEHQRMRCPVMFVSQCDQVWQGYSPLGVAGVRPPPPSAAQNKSICLYIAITMITRQSARPAHGVASVRYHKGWLSPERSLVITKILFL